SDKRVYMSNEVKVSSDENAVEFERDDLRKCRKTMNNMAVMNCHVKHPMWLSNLSQKPNDSEDLEISVNE
ncbi:17440_t:CDS:2, partial [Racocetra persica]